jgi:hypothetical protein
MTARAFAARQAFRYQGWAFGALSSPSNGSSEPDPGTSATSIGGDFSDGCFLTTGCGVNLVGGSCHIGSLIPGDGLFDNFHHRKAERKRLQIENASHKSARAKILKLADKTSNLRALVSSPAADWSIKRRMEYLGWARDVAKGWRGDNKWLEERFDQAAEEAERSIGC